MSGAHIVKQDFFWNKYLALFTKIFIFDLYNIKFLNSNHKLLHQLYYTVMTRSTFLGLYHEEYMRCKELLLYTIQNYKPVTKF
jgi:hypothetical protein